MANLKVNTDRVLMSANRIKGYNNSISSAITEMDRAINRLNAKWDGSASVNAINKYNAIKNAYTTPRYKVVDNFVAFMYQQVGEGYEQTEDVNKKLADAFK